MYDQLTLFDSDKYRDPNYNPYSFIQLSGSTSNTVTFSNSHTFTFTGATFYSAGSAFTFNLEESVSAAQQKETMEELLSFYEDQDV